MDALIFPRYCQRLMPLLSVGCTRKRSVSRRTCAMLFGWVSLLLCNISPAAVPGQFIAKMYTEVLGRAPDPTGWKGALGYFEPNGCNATLLQTWGSQFFTSTEFNSLQYDNDAITLILYRAILNREPDANGYQHWLGVLNSGTPLASVVADFFESSEFTQSVSSICSGTSYSFNNLGTGGLAIQIPASGAGYSGLSETQLQTLLDQTPSGGTVQLQQKSVVYLDTTLYIPDGVTLTTYGAPTHNQHAFMARLVRSTPFANALVNVGNGTSSAALTNIWVDGQRQASNSYVLAAINVQITGGTAMTVSSNFISNSLGWTNVHGMGPLSGVQCNGYTISNNVITAYPAMHAGVTSEYTDGISVGCQNATIEGNQIVDPTDVGVVLFNSYPNVQQSIVSSNTIVSAGHSAFSALAYDTYYVTSPPAPSPSFAGASITSNTLWSSPNSHFIIGLAVGSLAWWGDRQSSGIYADIGSGASATDNTTAGILTNFGEGIAVSGMLSATVESNTFTGTLIPQSYTNCPIGNVLASVSAGYASGSIQPYTDTTVIDCMSDFGPN
jgi:hypothetical protein